MSIPASGETVHESRENMATDANLSGVSEINGKNSFAVGCSNVYMKGSVVKVYIFISDP